MTRRWRQIRWTFIKSFETIFVLSRMKPAVWYLSMLIVAFLYFYVLAVQYIRAAEIPHVPRTIASVMPTFPVSGKRSSTYLETWWRWDIFRIRFYPFHEPNLNCRTSIYSCWEGIPSEGTNRSSTTGLHLPQLRFYDQLAPRDECSRPRTDCSLFHWQKCTR